jgi:hypothetical protein
MRHSHTSRHPGTKQERKEESSFCEQKEAKKLHPWRSRQAITQHGR